MQLHEIGAESRLPTIKLPSWLPLHPLLLQELLIIQLAPTAPYTSTHPSFPLFKFWEAPGGFLCGKAGGPHLLESGWCHTAFSSLFSSSTIIWRMAANKGRSGELLQDDEQRRQVLPLRLQYLGSKPTRGSALWTPRVNVGQH